MGMSNVAIMNDDQCKNEIASVKKKDPKAMTQDPVNFPWEPNLN